ncbi:hypothetical protein ACVLV4_000437 [Rathayibacter agropyri]
MGIDIYTRVFLPSDGVALNRALGVTELPDELTDSTAHLMVTLPVSFRREFEDFFNDFEGEFGEQEYQEDIREEILSYAEDLDAEYVQKAQAWVASLDTVFRLAPTAAFDVVIS